MSKNTKNKLIAICDAIIKPIAIFTFYILMLLSSFGVMLYLFGLHSNLVDLSVLIFDVLCIGFLLLTIIVEFYSSYKKRLKELNNE